jgi:hypothetical protein
MVFLGKETIPALFGGLKIKNLACPPKERSSGLGAAPRF